MAVASTVVAATAVLPLRLTSSAASLASYCSNSAPLFPTNRGFQDLQLAISSRKHRNTVWHQPAYARPYLRRLAQVISEEAEVNSGAEDTIFGEGLERAIEEEDYAHAGSWEIVCNADYEFPLQIDLKDVKVHVRGTVGYVSCMEVVKSKGSGWGKQVATNVFEKIDGQ